MLLTFTLCREAYRAALILIEEGAISRAGFNGPYTENGRQVGFVNYGTSHIMRLVGTGELAQRASWYQKWNVHLFARPEVRLHCVANSDYDLSNVYRGLGNLRRSVARKPLLTRSSVHARCLVFASTIL